MESYQYMPLQYDDSVRLMTLHAAPRSSPLQISLSEARLWDNPPTFEALSYTWATESGDDSLSSVVICNGGGIPVTKNCEAVLRRLRQEDADRVLWVDAICIWQHNLTERSLQVSLMRSIYFIANEVIIWLGEASEDVFWLEASEDIGTRPSLPLSSIFLRCIHEVANEIRKFRALKLPLTEYKRYNQVKDADSTSPFRRGLQDVINRRWWQRVWVIQEAALAKHATFLCGEQTAPYKDFLDVWTFATVDKSNGRSQGTLWWWLVQARDHLQLTALGTHIKVDQWTPWDKIMNVLNMSKDLKCSDPRDKIFGIIGLYQELRDLIPPPDYDKPVSEVFIEVTKMFLDKSKSLDLQCSVPVADLDSNHPSWAWSWNMSVTGNESKLLGLNNPKFDAARKSEVQYQLSSNDKELHVLGLKFDVIDKVSHDDSYVRTEQVPPKQILIRWLDSCRLALSLETYPFATETVKGAFIKSVCHNQISDHDFLEFENRFDEWHSYAQEVLESPVKLEHELNEKPHFIISSSPVCITRKGYLGTIPFASKSGDIIAVLSGGRIPLVIRPVVGDSNATIQSFRLIGPCYIHGIMNGEAFPEDLSALESICLV